MMHHPGFGRLTSALRDPEQPVLAGRVDRRPRRAAHDHRRADVDDRAAGAAVEHPHAELVDHQQRAPDVHVEDVVERRLVELAPTRLRGGHVADVVDEHVDVSGLLRHPLDLLPGRDVALHERRLGARVAHACRGLLRTLRRRAVVHDHPRGPFLRGPLGQRRAEARPGAGDHHRLALQPSAHSTLRPPSM
jgi:hypothetical protein